MTKKEYISLYGKARKQYPFLNLKAIKQLKAAYKDAIIPVIKKIAEAEIKEYSPLTIGKYKQILAQILKAQKGLSEQQLILDSMIETHLNSTLSNWHEITNAMERASYDIVDAVNSIIPDTIKPGIELTSDIHEKYLIDAVKYSNGKIKEIGIKNIFIAVNHKLLSSTANRVYQDGYSFSSRVWKAGKGIQEDIKRLLLSGLAQNRDAIEIAKDLDVYVNQGYDKLMKRYGKLIQGTTAFKNRMRHNVYYPSIRLVRSELYASIQDNASYMGMVNPASTGLYDWIRNTNELFNCSCPDYALNSPYTRQTLPGYPHSNCLCTIRPRLMDSNIFFNDIKEWANGANITYIDNWYNQYYKPAANMAA